VLLLTDRDLSDSLGAEVELRALGTPSSNVGIVNASRSRGEDDDGAPGERVFLTVSNASDRTQRRLLRITVGGDELARQQLELAADARQHLSFLLPLGAPALLAELEHDQLELDDEAWLAPLAPRTLALSSELPTSELRMLGLSQEPGDLERWLALVPESLEASGPSLAHLAIGDGTRGVDERRWELSLVARGSERSDLIGPFLADKRHPLLAGLTLEGIVWSIQPDLVLPGAPLVSAGNTPILTEERINGGRRFHLNLDPERSSLQRSPDWPILLNNLAQLRRRELPGPERTNLALGEALVLRGEAGVQEYVLIGPEDERVIEAAGTLVIDELDAPGLYQLEQGGTPIASFGVSFLDAAESDLRQLATERRASDAKAGQLAAGASGLQLALLAIALVAWALDWFVLRPRRRRTA